VIALTVGSRFLERYTDGFGYATSGFRANVGEDGNRRERVNVAVLDSMPAVFFIGLELLVKECYQMSSGPLLLPIFLYI
jgi:hypothetical protein